MSNFQIGYNWFYSSLSQSLAAMIGVVGMFIVYRLQIQQDKTNNALSILRGYLGGDDFKNYSHLTQEEILNIAENKIKHLKDKVEEYEKRLQDLKKDKNRTQDEIDRGVNPILNSIKGYEEKLSEFESKTKSVKDMDDHKHIIKWLAFPTILWLVGLFILSLLGLISSDFFKSNYIWGNVYTTVIFLLLLLGLALIVWCCGVSLDMGKPTTFVIKLRKLLDTKHK